MNQPQLFDIIELLVNLPNQNMFAGSIGTIVECYDDSNNHNDQTYEVEFANEFGETLALCNLAKSQFIVVWQAKTKTWVSLADRLTTIISNLSVAKQQDVLLFAQSLLSQQTES